MLTHSMFRIVIYGLFHFGIQELISLFSGIGHFCLELMYYCEWILKKFHELCHLFKKYLHAVKGCNIILDFSYKFHHKYPSSRRSFKCWIENNVDDMLVMKILVGTKFYRTTFKHVGISSTILMVSA